MNRPPAFAGQFYPEEKQELESMIDKFLSQVERLEVKGEIFGLLLPHAGYVFSGEVVAYGIKAILWKKFDTVILIGDSHQEYFDGVSIWPEGFWETPLGKVAVDKDLAAKILSSSDRFLIRDSAHLFEHSLEVHLPFLQKTLKGFKILPIIFGSENKDWQKLAQALLENIQDKKVLIIASSDLSHYLPYREAQKIDQGTLAAILNLSNQNLEVCGKDAIKTLLEISRNLGAKVKLLKYANSGDAVPGDKAQVVGYGAVVFYKEAKEALFKEEKEELLEIAQASVESFVREGKLPEIATRFARLKIPQGAFVTLKINGRLRGCLGKIEADLPLFQTVSQMAIAAAVKDGRFSPVSKDELEKLEYEISVLSPLRKIDKPKEIKIGRHGVLATIESRGALFLPQVALEQNWGKKDLLDNLMFKAGLWPGYWQKNQVGLYVFEAEIFSKNVAYE